MNAFDAASASAGNTGLASLFATTTIPADGQVAAGPAQGGSPFSQLLDQLNKLAVPQRSAPQVPQPVPQPARLAPTLATLPEQQSSAGAGTVMRPAAQVDQVPARVAALDCGLRLPGTGKIMPPGASHGTILPGEPAIDALPVAASWVVAEMPVTDQPAEHAGDQVASLVPPVAGPSIIAALQPVAFIASGAPVRSPGGGTTRGSAPISHEPTSSAAAPNTASVPPAPAVMLTAADAPVVAAGEASPTAERTLREPSFAAAPTRPVAPVAIDMHAPAETIAAAPQVRPEPQQLAMQDLTQIVERLTAAREAAAPATTQLAVDHAEFGPLSLSIRQGDGGELAIAVAAADRDSQAALVAAIAQGEAPGFEQAPDRRGSESAGREPATASQQGEHRGQRDRLAGQQQQRHPVPQRGPSGEQDGETRNGTYA